MSIPGLPFSHAITGAAGVADGDPIAVPSIKVGDRVLAVIQFDVATGECTGLNPANFVVSNGAIESATDDTLGLHVIVIWSDHEPDAS